MESSKVPFIAEYDPYSKTRPLKRWRPRSTQPWTISLFLAATGICFGLLLAISLIEKEPAPITKRDVHSDEKSVNRQPALSERQDATCTDFTTVTVPATYTETDAVTTNPCVVTVTLPPGSSDPYLSLTTQCTTTIVELVTVCSPLEGYVCASTMPTVAAAAAAASTGSCIPTTLTETLTDFGSYVPSTTQCTVYVTELVTTCSPLSGYVCPTATSTTAAVAVATTGSCSTSTATMVYWETGSYLVLTTQDPTLTISPLTTQETTPSTLASASPSPQEITSSSTDQITPGYTSTTLQETATGVPVLVMTTTMTMISTTIEVETTTESAEVSSMSTETAGFSAYLSLTEYPTRTDSSAYLSLTEQPSATTNENPSSSPTTPEFSSTTLVPFVNPTAQTTSTTVLTPFVNPLAHSTYTTTLQDLAETLSLSLGEQTTMTASGATYVFVASTDGIRLTVPMEQTPTSMISSTTQTTTGTTLTSSQPASTSANFTLDQNFVLIKLQPFHTYYYFLALYLPKLIAVLMTTLWTIIFAELKLMEPFYQLSANKGALANDSMFGNYLSSEMTISSLSATFGGQWVLLLGGTILITWAAIVALVSESMIVVSQGTCTNLNEPTVPYACDPGWAVNEPILTVLLVLTGFIFVLVFILMLVLSRRKRTGVFHDPSSIAAMAELLGNPLVMEDFHAIKPSSSDREVKLLLGQNRYRIGLYDPMTGRDALFSLSQHYDLRWGLIKLDQNPRAQSINDRRLAEYNAVLNPNIASTEELKANRKRRIFQFVYDALILLTAMCIFALILGYWLDAKYDPLNDFFNSNTFGPRFVLTCLSLILSIGWRSTSQEMTVMAPYRAMARAYEAQSGVMGSRSILTPTARTPWTALFKGLKLRQYMVTMAATCAVLADLLLIAVSGVPYRASQLRLSLKISVFASLSILGIMILTSLAVIIYNRTSAGGTRKLPRSPNTLIGVWLYLCHSKLVNQGPGSLDDFSSPLDGTELAAKYGRYQYGFTRKTGLDGVGRWTIDTVLGLHAETLPAKHHNPHYQNHHQPVINTNQQGLQPFEASATPVEGPFGYQTRQDPFMYRTAAHRQPHNSPYGIPYFEAQAKSPVAQVSPSRFEDLRTRPPSQAQAQPKPRSVQREEPAPTPHEALAQWEYEQEFHNPRRMGAGSAYNEGRWTNDGRSQYRYG